MTTCDFCGHSGYDTNYYSLFISAHEGMMTACGRGRQDDPSTCMALLQGMHQDYISLERAVNAREQSNGEWGVGMHGTIAWDHDNQCYVTAFADC